MRTLRDAAALLTAPTSAPELARLAAAVGCGTEPLPLEQRTLAALALDDTVREAFVARGPGALRALLLELSGHRPLREAIAALAARLSARAPHLLWLAIAIERAGTRLTIATWSPGATRPRVVALIADRRRILPSDAETLCALAAASGAQDLLVHARWLEILGSEVLTRRFYHALERTIESLASARTDAPHDERRTLAFLHVSRLLFLSFLQTKGWLDGDRDFLQRGFHRCMAAGGDYHRKVLRPLIFGTLNTPPHRRAPAARALGALPFLNGGLFAPSSLERRRRAAWFPDDALGLVFSDLLSCYRFTAREESSEWSEAAIDPEMLGKAFEALMAASTRRATGAFYTPRPLVRTITGTALTEALACRDVPPATVERALAGEIPDDGLARTTLRMRTERLALVDPACGSGAFLVYALEEVASLLRCLGDRRPVAEVRRAVLARSIFGVDTSPTAVWLCELRLWLSVVIECEAADPLAVAPLPNLDRHIRVGDSLAGPGWEEAAPIAATRVAVLRQRYARATGARKRTLQQALDRAERAQASAWTEARIARLANARRELLSALRTRDLFGHRHHATATEQAFLVDGRARLRELRAERRRLADGGALPFSWLAAFPDIAASGGFDLALGNPPWVRLNRIPATMRATLCRSYRVFAHAGCPSGAALAHAGRGFGAQVDLASLFVERSLALVRGGGMLALLLPAKLWSSLAGGGVRRLLTERARLIALEDWSDAPPAIDASVYPSLLAARRPEGPGRADPTPVAVAVHRPEGTYRWHQASEQLGLDDDPAAPWLLLPQPVRAAFDRLTLAGVPLADTPLGRPILGVKCGCNDAFIVRLEAIQGGLATVTSGERHGVVEGELLRPLLRGETLSGQRKRRAAEYILWTHDATGAPLDRLPPNAARWLAVWQRQLSARADARSVSRWWSLFRVGAASNTTARVVWADVARRPHARVLLPGDPTVPLNSCYVVACHDPTDAYALAALLNSPLAAAWLIALAEPARGLYRRFLAWTTALLPLPRHWARARELLAPLSPTVSPDELTAATLRAYQLLPADVEPLLAWCVR